MPTYEYRCRTCQRPVTIFFRSFSQVDADPACTHCGAHTLDRRMSRPFIHRGRSAAERVESPDEMYGDMPVFHGGTEPVAGVDGWEELSDTDFASGAFAAGSGAERDSGDEDVAALARQARQMAAMLGEQIDAPFDRALQHIEGGADVEDVFGEMDARGATDGHDEGPPSAAATASDDPAS